MILTLCTACAAPLPEDDAVQCACATRYCSDRCERYDRRRGGHGKICGAIASGGGAEQYHADKKYEEAVADAVEECAEDTEGQTCLHLSGRRLGGRSRARVLRAAGRRASRMCRAWRGRRRSRPNSTFIRWHTCGLCEQQYHGVVRCALGWACWKTYVGRPETDKARGFAMDAARDRFIRCKSGRGGVDRARGHFIYNAANGASEGNMLTVQANIVNTLEEVGRAERQCLCEMTYTLEP